jgi:hypothetical protein
MNDVAATIDAQLNPYLEDLKSLTVPKSKNGLGFASVFLRRRRS